MSVLQLFLRIFQSFWEIRNPNLVLKPILHHYLCTLHKIFAEDSSRTSPIVLRLLHNYCVDESFEFNVRNSINDTQALELYGTVGLIPEFKKKNRFNFSNFIMSCTFKICVIVFKSEGKKVFLADFWSTKKGNFHPSENTNKNRDISDWLRRFF